MDPLVVLLLLLSVSYVERSSEVCSGKRCSNSAASSTTGRQLTRIARGRTDGSCCCRLRWDRGPEMEEIHDAGHRTLRFLTSIDVLDALLILILLTVLLKLFFPLLLLLQFLLLIV